MHGMVKYPIVFFLPIVRGFRFACNKPATVKCVSYSMNSYVNIQNFVQYNLILCFSDNKILICKCKSMENISNWSLKEI